MMELHQTTEQLFISGKIVNILVIVLADVVLRNGHPDNLNSHDLTFTVWSFTATH
ncbi:hypothetical protein C0J52_06954 [Blattella germanica]|nr:hypothetical protein C0J52_06954 [Blattella germanica]